MASYTSGPHPSTPDFYVAVTGVGGEVVNVPGFYMNTLTLPTTGGPITWSHVPVLVLDLPDPSGTGDLPGVLGTNLFTDRNLVVNGAVRHDQRMGRHQRSMAMGQRRFGKFQ